MSIMCGRGSPIIRIHNFPSTVTVQEAVSHLLFLLLTDLLNR